jgi:hypothetical protein
MWFVVGMETVMIAVASMALLMVSGKAEMPTGLVKYLNGVRCHVIPQELQEQKYVFDCCQYRRKIGRIHGVSKMSIPDAQNDHIGVDQFAVSRCLQLTYT